MSPDDQQPWAGRRPDLVQPEKSAHNSLDLAFNRPWLAALKGADELTAEDRETMQALTSRYTRPDPRMAVAGDDLGVRERIRRTYSLETRPNGLVGRPVVAGGPWDPPGGAALPEYLRSMAEVARLPQLRALHRDMVIHLLEQGFAAGNANCGRLTDEALFAEGLLARVVLASATELEKVGRLRDAVGAVVWIALEGDELRKEPMGNASASRLRSAVEAVAQLPESPQKLQRIMVLEKYAGRIGR